MLISFIFVIGCADSKEPDVFQGNLAKGILYNDKFYWQTKMINKREEGKVKAAEELIGETIYFNDEVLYVEKKAEIQVFQYVTEMELGQEVPLNSKAESEGMALPHFVYENMRYLLNTELSVEKLPKSFVKAGEIEKTCTVAAENNTGNLDVGTEFYASEHQNRYMIVQNADYTYSIYENEGYSQ